MRWTFFELRKQHNHMANPQLWELCSGSARLAWPAYQRDIIVLFLVDIR